jgi:hypothetical protein
MKNPLFYIVGVGVTVIIGIAIMNSKEIQDKIKDAIKQEYKHTGHISFASWYFHPFYCLKLKRSKP